MISDRVGDFIVRLKNAGAVGKTVVLVPYSEHLAAIAEKLRAVGFVGSIETNGRPNKVLSVSIAYDESGRSRIHGVKRLSRPGCRSYLPARLVHGVKGGRGARILSTPRGILTDAEARKVRSGGEALFEIW